MVLFILFPGLGIQKKIWELTIIDNKLVKLNFLKELKKLGEVYTYTPNVYKFYYYKKYPPKLQKLENKFKEKPVPIELDQFDIDKECKRIYDEVKSYKGKFIPIGHSAGGWFAYRFSQLYPKRCSKMVLIESGRIISKYGVKQIKDKLKNKRYKITLKFLNNIVDNIKTKKYSDELVNIALYKYMSYVKKMNGKIDIPTLLFEDINITNHVKEDNKKIIKYEKELTKINRNKIRFINLNNTDHFPWEIPHHSKEMIRQIKCFVI